MTRMFALAMLASVLVAAEARAACEKDADCGSGSVCSAGKCVAKSSGTAETTSPGTGTSDLGSTSLTTVKRGPGVAWAGLGLYGLSVSIDTGTAFGTVSATSTRFGVNGGGAYNVLTLAPDLFGAAFGNLGVVLTGGDLFLPLTVGGAIRYDKLGPVQVVGGLGLTVMPHTGGGSTPIGAGILLTGLYPLEQMAKNLSGQAQLGYNIMNNGFSLWTISIGVGYGF